MMVDNYLIIICALRCRFCLSPVTIQLMVRRRPSDASLDHTPRPTLPCTIPRSLFYQEITIYLNASITALSLMNGFSLIKAQFILLY
jgi:hypothetical protein